MQGAGLEGEGRKVKGRNCLVINTGSFKQMSDKILIKLINPKVIGLLREMEELCLIKILDDTAPPKTKLSDKYRGVFSKEDADSFDLHTQTMRKE